MNTTMICTARVFELARFCGVGLLCLAVGVGVLAALCQLAGLNYLLAFAGSFVASNSLGYVLNGRFTFGARLERSGVIRYMIVNAISLAVNCVLLKLLVDDLHIWYITATLVLAAANAPASFTIHRIISYRSGRTLSAAHPGATRYAS